MPAARKCYADIEEYVTLWVIVAERFDGGLVVSINIVCYLFLAGAGSCTFLVGSAVDAAMRVRPSFRAICLSRITDAGLVAGPAVAILGTVFLIADLGVPGRFLLALVSPSSILTWGAWSLLLFVLFSLCALALSPFASTLLGRAAESTCQVAAIVCAVFVWLYSAVFLSGYPSVPFLNSVALPVLFAFSSLSAGVALIFLVAAARGFTARFAGGVRRLVRLEAVVIVFEAVALVAFVGSALLGGDAARGSAIDLLSGGRSAVFWLGAVGLGLFAPLAIDLANNRKVHTWLVGAGALCVLLGTFFLRYVVLTAAVRYGLPFMQVAPFWS